MFVWHRVRVTYLSPLLNCLGNDIPCGRPYPLPAGGERA
jgi:hypothetical protein